MNRYRNFPARKGLLADPNGVFRMWRSFFYAVGIGLFALGLQTLVVEHVTVPKDTKLQKLIRKILEEDKPAVARVQPVQPQVNAPSMNRVAPNWARQAQAPNPAANQSNQSYRVNTGSRFGPSRFSGPAYGTGYGGRRVNSASAGRSPQNSGPQFNAPQFGGSPQTPNRTNAQLAGFSNSGNPGNTRPTGPAMKRPVKLQKVLIREWMPWSLLASGAIIFLYTHTHQRRSYSD